jgi:probable O-glycosylation ligase (exosortase A-associated)
MSKFVILFVATYIGSILATLLVDVAYGVYLYQLDYFIFPPSRWWYGRLPDLRYSFTIAVFVVISFYLQRYKYTKNRVFSVPQTKWLMLNEVWFAATTLWAVYPDMHKKVLMLHCKLMVFLYIAFRVIDSREKINRLIWVYLVGNFYTGWVGHNTGRQAFGRMEAIGPADTGGDGNSVAAILITAVPFLFFHLLKGNKWQKFISLLFLAFIIDSIVLINSRGGFIGLIFGLGYMVFLLVFRSRMSSSAEKVVIVFSLLAFTGLFFYLTDAAFWERMQTIVHEAQSDRAGGGRVFYWMKTFDLVANHPLGVGVWGYQALSPNFIPQEYLTEGRRAVHSLYFQCLAERGYLGMVLFIGLLASNFFYLWRTKKLLAEKRDDYSYLQATAIEASFVSFLVASAFLNHLHMEVLYFFMLFIACFGVVHRLDRSQADEDSV